MTRFSVRHVRFERWRVRPCWPGVSRTTEGVPVWWGEGGWSVELRPSMTRSGSQPSAARRSVAPAPDPQRPASTLLRSRDHLEPPFEQLIHFAPSVCCCARGACRIRGAVGQVPVRASTNRPQRMGRSVSGRAGRQAGGACSQHACNLTEPPPFSVGGRRWHGRSGGFDHRRATLCLAMGTTTAWAGE